VLYFNGHAKEDKFRLTPSELCELAQGKTITINSVLKDPRKVASPSYLYALSHNTAWELGFTPGVTLSQADHLKRLHLRANKGSVLECLKILLGAERFGTFQHYANDLDDLRDHIEANLNEQDRPSYCRVSASSWSGHAEVQFPEKTLSYDGYSIDDDVFKLAVTWLVLEKAPSANIRKVLSRSRENSSGHKWEEITFEWKNPIIEPRKTLPPL